MIQVSYMIVDQKLCTIYGADPYAVPSKFGASVSIPLWQGEKKVSGDTSFRMSTGPNGMVFSHMVDMYRRYFQ
jgi:hypothetical protein